MEMIIGSLVFLTLSLYSVSIFADEATKVIIPGYKPPTISSPATSSTTTSTTTTTDTSTQTTPSGKSNSVSGFDFSDPKQTATFNNFFDNLKGCIPGTFTLQHDIMDDSLVKKGSSVTYKIIGKEQDGRVCHMEILLSDSFDVEYQGSDLLKQLPDINVNNLYHVNMVGRDCLLTRDSIDLILKRRSEILGKTQFPSSSSLNAVLNTDCRLMGELGERRFLIYPH